MLTRINVETGIRVDIEYVATGEFRLTHYDIDSENVIETRYYRDRAAAQSYAAKCVSNTIPRGTLVLVA